MKNTLADKVLTDPVDFPDAFKVWVVRHVQNDPNFRIDVNSLPVVEAKKYIGAGGAPAFQNAWVNFGGTNEPAHYYKDPFGRIWIGGCIKTGTIGLVAFTLPAGYRPPTQVIQAVESNGAFGSVVINTSGTVVPTVGNNVSFNLSGINYRQFA